MCSGWDGTLGLAQSIQKARAQVINDILSHCNENNLETAIWEDWDESWEDFRSYIEEWDEDDEE